jgi:predicted DsbA family dithiol-disulfide isomerase
MDAYWAEAQDIGDADVLRAAAAAAGLPADEVEDVLAGDRYRDRIESSTREAVSMGANAVPAFVLDRRLLVLGAQPDELFEQAFAQLERG